MTIRQKTLLLTGSLLAFSLLLVLLVSRTVLVQQISNLELRRAHERLDIIFRLLNSRREEVTEIAAHWGAWTQTWRFMQDGNRAFVNDDLSAEELRSLKVDYLLLLAPDGTIRAAGAAAGTEVSRDPGRAETVERLRQVALTAPPDAATGRSGFFRKGNRFFIVACQPITSPDGGGVSLGFIVCAEELHQATITRMAELAGQPFALLPADSPELLPWVRDRLARLTPPAFLEFNVDENTFEGVGVIPDLLSPDKIVVHLHGDRSYYRETKKIIWFFIATITGIGALLSLGMLAMLGRIVLNPLDRLSRQVADSGATIITPPGGEELNHLTQVINETMRKLRESEERYRIFVQNFPGIAFRADFDFNVEFLHGAVTQITGYPLEEFLERRIRWDTIIHPDDLPILTGVRSLFETIPGYIDEYEYRIIRNDGTIRLLHTVWQGVCCDLSGRPNGVQGVMYDITEKRALEVSVRESEERYRSFIQNFTGIAFRVRLGTEVVFLHGAVEAITGYTPEDFSSRTPSWRDIVAADDREEFDRMTAALASHPGEVMALEYRITRKDGEIRWLYELISSTGDEQHAAVVVQGAAYDITARKQAEEALVQARDEAQRANRAKSEFLATMSHELRTPLTAILGLSEMLQEQARGPLTAYQLRSVRTIEESGRHLLNLINDILDLASIEAGKLVIYREMVAVEELCRSCLQIVSGPAATKRITLSLNLDQAPETIEADHLRLSQILVNLLSNGVKFTPEGGAVGIRVIGDRDRGVIRFTVWDTGIGISVEDRHELFSPFMQVDSSLSRRHQGTGLGLALVARLTTLQKGTVSLESEAGAGSRFTVTLPWQEGSTHEPPEIGNLSRPPEAQSGPPVVATSALAVSPLILLTEDNPVTREMTSEFLLGRKFQVMEAADGTEALELLKEYHPDLILMDVQMPGIDGIETIRRIRALPSTTGRIPIIALTAFAMQQDRERCLAAGADEYLSKPIRLTYLTERIIALLAAAGSEPSGSGGTDQ